jgi:hypothetical protein
MSLPNKILPADYAGHDVQSLTDQPALSAAELKAAFDYMAEQLIIPRFN